MEVFEDGKVSLSAILKKEGKFYIVRFPDLESCYCLTLYYLEKENADIPPASEMSALKPEPDEFVSLVACDTVEYWQIDG